MSFFHYINPQKSFLNCIVHYSGLRYPKYRVQRKREGVASLDAPILIGGAVRTKEQRNKHEGPLPISHRAESAVPTCCQVAEGDGQALSSRDSWSERCVYLCGERRHPLKQVLECHRVHSYVALVCFSILEHQFSH